MGSQENRQEIPFGRTRLGHDMEQVFRAALCLVEKQPRPLPWRHSSQARAGIVCLAGLFLTINIGNSGSVLLAAKLDCLG